MSQAQAQLKVKLLSEHATLPTRGSQRAAGYDLHSAQDTVVPSRGKQLVLTDLAVQVPPGTYGRIAPRSGLAARHFIDVGAGVVDEDYRGNVAVLLFNHSNEDYAVGRGDRIAQLVLERIATPEVVRVDDDDDDALEPTARGSAGFGSTGT